MIDRAGRLALAASAAGLAEQRPALREALGAALSPVPTAQWGRESVADNRLAREWLVRQLALERAGMSPAEAGRAAALRIFGDAPGAYGAGVNRLTERSGAWRERKEIGRAYRNRMGHAYGLNEHGQASHARASANAAPWRAYKLHQAPVKVNTASFRILTLLGVLLASLALFSLGLWRGHQVPQSARSIQ